MWKKAFQAKKAASQSPKASWEDIMYLDTGENFCVAGVKITGLSKDGEGSKHSK